ncbi:MAG: hypothetical protein IJ278_00995 [Clostridia bacterium]|nr:hypothetical protein [Clostridia bacterium]
MFDFIYMVCVAQSLIFVFITVSTNGLWFDVRYNYEKWYELNWFAVWLFTVAYYIICLPVALLYWSIRLAMIGRK